MSLGFENLCIDLHEHFCQQIMENAEINNIIKIVGLQYKKSYEDPESLRSLRYGKIMIMTDQVGGLMDTQSSGATACHTITQCVVCFQDQDGSHIKGLLINFFHHNWPSLLKHTFLEEFITPIVKVRKTHRNTPTARSLGKSGWFYSKHRQSRASSGLELCWFVDFCCLQATKNKQELAFYSIPEFDEWKKQTDNYKTWNIKYYKGLLLKCSHINLYVFIKNVFYNLRCPSVVVNMWIIFQGWVQVQARRQKSTLPTWTGTASPSDTAV